jgi:hypothetical protein
MPDPTPRPTPAPQPLTHSARTIDKATLVSIEVPRDPGTDASLQLNQALAKFSFLRHLALQPGEVRAVRDHLERSQRHPELPYTAPNSPTIWDLLARFEDSRYPTNLPSPSKLSDVPLDALRNFGKAVEVLRSYPTLTQSPPKLALGALAASPPAYMQAAPGAPPAMARKTALLLRAARYANRRLELRTTAAATVLPIGWINLERLEMAPAGIVRGELLATIPLAPLEETAVVQKEWSVTTKEFTSIVTDSLEDISETGVTDNTELAQGTQSQQQHNNQFNITGTVSGGIPVISGSSTSGFTAQDAESQSATESRKHAKTVTQKASSRSKQEHKVTISTTTVTGSSETTTRTLKNPSSTDPIRIDYFSMMREWRVRLYRYGLRLTYDIVIPEPGAALREAYAYLAYLRSLTGPFVFPEKLETIAGNNYESLADKYQASVPVPPQDTYVITVSTPLTGLSGADNAIHDCPVTFTVKPDYQVRAVQIDAEISSPAQIQINFDAVGTDFRYHGGNATLPTRTLKRASDPNINFLSGATGDQTIVFIVQGADAAAIVLTVETNPTAQAMARWRSDVWNALYNAAQARYYAQQQDIAAKIADLEAQLLNVDTLTLRREESEEIMKVAVATLVGNWVGPMWTDLQNIAAQANPPQPQNVGPLLAGTAFAGNPWSGLDIAELVAAVPDEEYVRFVNQAIEWENVVTFLYPYFWDIPASWNFIRTIQHRDPTRQAFLRAGSARVVLTVRKGWERKWTNFVETGEMTEPASSNSPYMTIAEEMAAYDDRNYPGIPPANPGEKAVRLEDGVYTIATRSVAANANPVTIDVQSSKGFLLDRPVVIDAYDPSDPLQESKKVVAIPSATSITVESLGFAHDASDGGFRVFQPGEKGVLIAEWNEYTPTSGTDIAVTSNLHAIA